MTLSLVKLVLAAALVASGTARAAAPAVDDFAFAMPVEIAGGDAFYQFAIPQAVYEATAFSDLRDLRVINGDGQAVPYAFRTVQLRSQKFDPVALSIFPLRGPRTARAEDLDLSVGKSGNKVSVRVRSRGEAGAAQVLLGYLIDASAIKSRLAGITIRWSADGADWLTSVRLETSNDLKNWKTLVNDAPLGGVSHAGQRLERNSIEFRGGQEKYLRLMWLDPEKSIEVDSVRGIVAEQWEQPERTWKEVIARPDSGSGNFLVDLEGRFPIDRLEFKLPQQNTVVPVQVSGRDDPKEKWRPLATTVAYRLQQDGRELISPALVLGGYPNRYWLLNVNAMGGGIGTGNLAVRAGWIPRELVFAARGKGPFRLAYGNALAEAGAMYEEELLPGLHGDHPPKIAAAVTGKPQKLAGMSALDPPINIRKWALWAALLAAVGVLGWMTWRLVKQMNRPGA